MGSSHRQVVLIYELPRNFCDLEEAAELGETAKRIVRATQALNNTTSAADVVHDPLRTYGVTSRFDFVLKITDIKPEQPGLFETAVRQYISTAGPPAAVGKHSDYGVLERILQPMGLGLEKQGWLMRQIGADRIVVHARQQEQLQSPGITY